MSPDPTSPPAELGQRSVRVEQLDRELTLDYRLRQRWQACWLVVVFVAWSAACVPIVAHAVAARNAFTWLFATPFLAEWYLLLFALHQALLGWERLRIGPGGLVHEQRGVGGVRRRELPLAEVQAFDVCTTTAGKQQAPVSYLRIRTLGRPLAFAKGVSESELRWLAELLRSHCSVLRGDAEPLESRAALPDDDEAQHGAEQNGAEQNGDDPNVPCVEVLTLAERPIEPPSDCSFTLRHAFDGIYFERRGCWNLAAIGAATLMCAFWNGIVGIFVHQLIGNFGWFLCLFLLPFELIGLVIFLVWLTVIFAPAVYAAWSFGGYEITSRWSFFGFGFTRRRPVMLLDRIELRERAPARRAAGETGASQQDATPPSLSSALGDFSLSFVTRDEQELLAITGLTEGEARWMADVVYRQVSAWFPRR